MTPAFSPLTANYSLQLPNSSVFAVTFTDTYPMQTGQITFTADGRPAGSGAATTLLLDQDTVHVTITAACERPPFRAGILSSLHRSMVSHIHVHGHVYLGTS